MPRSRKLFIHNFPYFITFRTEVGLPFSPSVLLSDAVWGILARAQSTYPVEVCAFIFMGNHVHMLVVPENPELIPHFIRHIKTETAHLINRLLGRRRRTLWASGYDSIALLSIENCLERLEYIYTNPQRSRLESTIEKYPLPSSWSMYMERRHVRKCVWIRRPAVPTLGKTKFRQDEQFAIAREMKADAKIHHTFKLSPYAWLKNFPESANLNLETVREEIIKRVRECERRCDRAKPAVLGAANICAQDLSKPHEPKKFGRRMICMSRDKAKRSAFLDFYFALAEQARRAYQAWRVGDFSLRLPPGMFAPGGSYFASVLSGMIPVPMSA